ncbi:hypothetical protein FQA39_LY01554 [Lamprigera yunnana]|nr:hypothetical protein FQA39_LY01554 [Lamprigera yunnana]
MNKINIAVVVSALLVGLIAAQNGKTYVNPSILQDSRNLPQTDGTFGFLYRTEDGISHAAVGDPSGQVHGRFTYTDPTGLKVNFNYNAGSRTAPGYNYEQNQKTQAPQTKPESLDYEEHSAPQPQSYTKSRPRQSSYANQ